MGEIQRRQFLIAAGAILGAPLVAKGQRPVTRQRVAYLASDSVVSNACVSDPPSASWDAFLDGLRALGYMPGQNIALNAARQIVSMNGLTPLRGSSFKRNLR